MDRLYSKTGPSAPVEILQTIKTVLDEDSKIQSLSGFSRIRLSHAKLNQNTGGIMKVQYCIYYEITETDCILRENKNGNGSNVNDILN